MINTISQLEDHDTSVNLHAAILTAFRDATAVREAESVLAALRALANAENLVSILQNAVLESNVSGGSVAEQLSRRATALRKQTEMARTQKAKHKEKCDTRHAEVQPILNLCAGELNTLAEQAKNIERRIAGFYQEREANKARYKAAGLKPEEIEALGIKPTEADLVAWKNDLDLNKKRQAQLSAFVRSGPEYPEGILTEEKAGSQ